MDNSSHGEDSQSISASEGGHPEQSAAVSAASLKAMMHSSDVMSSPSAGHSNGQEQNGLSPVNSNHVDKPKDKHSSEKHRSKESSSSHSSSSKSKDGSSSSSSKHKDPNRHHSSSSSKHSSSSSSKHREGGSSSSSSKHRESSSSSSKHRDGHSSSSSKHSSSSSSKHSSSSSDKHRDKSSGEKHRSSEKSSSSGDKDKHRSSSSGDKHKSSSSSHSSSGDKHKERSKDKEHRSSSHKEHSSKHSSSSSKPKDVNSPKLNNISSPTHNNLASPKHEKFASPKHEPVSIKQEPVTSPRHSSDSSPSKSRLSDSSHSSPDKSSPRKMELKIERLDESDLSPTRHRIPVKTEPDDSEDDMPLVDRKANIKAVSKKRTLEESSDDEPLSSRMEKVKKVKKEIKEEKPKKRKGSEMEEERPKKKKKKLDKHGVKQEGKRMKKEKKEDNKPEVWRWWEEEKKDNESKWSFLEHKGPVFAEPYIPNPDNVKFYYDGKHMKLSVNAEEVGNFYARMLDHDYTTRDIFQKNFFKDWRKVMTKEEKEKITDLSKCNFKEYFDYYKMQVEERKNRTKEEKLELKEKNQAMLEEYGYCTIDGHKQKIGNFKIEPPGLFRGRGDHPKQGMLKRRVEPEDVIINCSKNAHVPDPPPGHKWKEVRHDNKVTWLASWTENVQGQTKYVMLNAASRLKGEKDWQKYEMARKLHKCVDKIRAQYQEDWKSKEMRIRQRAVALYFIDKLALRAGNEKDEDTADTVGCCSLRVEHLTLLEKQGDKEWVVEFDFLGKDSIRYQNSVSVEKKVFKNLQLFTQNKQPDDDIFDRLNTAILNKHLHDLMDGLTAKVFRTYNASKTLQDQLDLLTNEDDAVPAKLLAYNRANRAVAVLCNHQRAVPKNFSKQMENLQNKIKDKQKQIKEAKAAVKEAKSDVKNLRTEKAKSLYEKRKKAVDRLQDQLTKLEVQATDKDENKDIALGTSKLNYLDPRISVAWCKKYEVPIEKIYNKTQREKFQWAIDMAGPEYVF